MVFVKSPNADLASEVREFKTVDIVKRLGVLSPEHVHLKNYPIPRPVSIFNASCLVDQNSRVLYLYSRIIVGYYMYVSAIALVEIPLEDVLSGVVSFSHYPATIVVYPSTRYDIWGTEDPRVQEVSGKVCMIYAGRTINYFNPVVRRERTLPVIAVSTDNRRFAKTGAIVLKRGLRELTISDKDAVLLDVGEPEWIYVLHRPHLMNEVHYLAASKVSRSILDQRGGVTEFEVVDTKVIMEPARFEYKLGWATPPVELRQNEYLVLIHGVDREMEGYRAFAAMLRYDKDVGLRVVSVTPYYILEPKMVYELYGDRPFVVFPCGVARVNKNELLTVYGAADFFVGFGLVNLDEVLSLLDKGRLE